MRHNRAAAHQLQDRCDFYIDGSWVRPESEATREVINPATEDPVAVIALASEADTDKAVAAARRAFPAYAEVDVDGRLKLLGNLREIYKRRQKEVAEVISREMGAPIRMAMRSQAAAGRSHIRTTVRTLRRFKWQRSTPRSGTRVVFEPIGVSGLITPWNWPMNQIAVKVAPALAAGCTMVLKPSEIAPFDAIIFAEILDAAGVPAG